MEKLAKERTVYHALISEVHREAINIFHQVDTFKKTCMNKTKFFI